MHIPDDAPFFLRPDRAGVNNYQMRTGSYRVDLGDWLAGGWRLFVPQAGPSIVVAVCAGILLLLGNQLVPGSGLILQGPLLTGFIVVALCQIGGRKVELRHYAWGFRFFLPLLVVSVLCSVLVSVGLMLLVLPGIYLVVAYMLTPVLVVELNMDFWPAMELSRRIVSRHWFRMALLALVLAGVNMLGGLAAVLGLCVTVPFSMNVLTVAATDIMAELDLRRMTEPSGTVVTV